MATASDTPHEGPFRTTPVTVGVCIFVAIAGFFLWQEHRAHLLGVLPYLLLAACPIVHLFMHHGHGDHGSHGSDHVHHPHDDENGARS